MIHKFRNLLKFTERDNVNVMLRTALQLGLDNYSNLRCADLATGFGWFPLALECIGHDVLSLDGGEEGMREGASCLMLKEQPELHKIKAYESLPDRYANLDFVSMMGCLLRKLDGSPFDVREYGFYIRDLKGRLNINGKIYFRLSMKAENPRHYEDIWRQCFWDEISQEVGIFAKFVAPRDVYLGDWGDVVPFVDEVRVQRQPILRDSTSAEGTI